MAFLAVLMCLAILVLLIAKAAFHWQRRRQLPPGPPAWPIIGSLLHLLGGAPHRSLAKLSQQYGPFVFMMLGSMPTVLVSSPGIAKQFLQTHDKAFASRPHFESAERLNYGQDAGVATARYGPGWRELRRLYTLQLFTAKRVNQYIPIMEEEIKSLMKEIRGYADAGVAFDITAGTGSLLENIICRILLGKRLSEVCDVTMGYNLKQVVQEGTALFIAPIIGDFIPWLSFLDGKTKRKMDAWHASFDALLENVLTAREKEGAPSSNDFLQLLMANNLSRDKVKGAILELLSAGVDTSSVTLDWAMAELMINPEMLKKVEDEVEKFFGNSSKRMVQEEDLSQLVYTKAVIKETFRLHAPVPLLVTHMSIQDCQVGGYRLPQGTRLFVNAWAIGRDPQFWDCPDIFLPDRFLGSCGHLDVHGQNFELIPFGSGRRSCPGIPLALPIIEMTLANLVNSFHWTLPPPPHHKVDMFEKFGAVVSRTSPLLAIPTLKSL